MNNRINTFCYIVLATGIFFMSSPALALWKCSDGLGVQTYDIEQDCKDHCASSCDSSDPSDKTVSISDPLGKNGQLNLNEMIGTFLNAIMGLVGSLALLMFVYGGFVWMMSAGSNEQIQKGKNILTWATIGIFVIFASYGLVNFILKAISG